MYVDRLNDWGYQALEYLEKVHNNSDTLIKFAHKS